MKHTFITLVVAAGCGIASGAGAAVSKDEYKVQKDRIEADAKVARERCSALKDNAKDVCMAQAKGKEKIAKAELEASNNPSPRNDEKVKTAKADAAYDLAKEKCDDLSGDAKDVCVKDAKAAHASAKADSRMSRAAATNQMGAGTEKAPATKP